MAVTCSPEVEPQQQPTVGDVGDGARDSAEAELDEGANGIRGVAGGVHSDTVTSATSAAATAAAATSAAASSASSSSSVEQPQPRHTASEAGATVATEVDAHGDIIVEAEEEG